MRSSLGAAGIAALAVACCFGLPLVVAVGLGAALVWTGGAVAGVVALAVGIAALATRARRRRMRACRQPRHYVEEVP